MSSHRNPRSSRSENPSSDPSRSSPSSANNPLSPRTPSRTLASTPQGRLTSPKATDRALASDGDRGVYTASSGTSARSGQIANAPSRRGPHDPHSSKPPSTPERPRERQRDKPNSGPESKTATRLSDPFSGGTQKSEHNRSAGDSLSPTSVRYNPAINSTKAAHSEAIPVKSGTEAKLSELKMLAVNSKQTMHGNTRLLCYGIKKPQNVPPEPTEAAFMQSLSKVNFQVTSILVLTDYHSMVIVFTDSSANGSSDEPLDCGFTLTRFANVSWGTVLLSLHTATLPKAPAEKNGVMGFLHALLSQERRTNELPIPKAKLSPILAVQGVPFKAKKSFAALMHDFLASDGGNLRGLETYIKGLRVEAFQSKGKDQASNTGKEKKITGLARPDDGHRSKGALQPRVKKYGGGSKDVEFYFKPGRKYITVFDYFRDHKKQTIRGPDQPLVNIGTRSKPTYIPPEFCNLVEGRGAEGLVLSFNDVMEIVKNRAAKIPKWLSSGDYSDDTRYPGLKMPLAETSSLCQVTMTASMLLTSCRTKTAPMIQYREGFKIETVSGSWDMESTGMKPSTTSPAQVKVRCKASVLMVGCGEWSASEKATETIQALRAQLRVFGIVLSDASPLQVPMADERLKPQVQADIRSRISEIKGRAEAVVIMLHHKSRLLYDYVKRLCDVEYGVHSVCLDASKLAMGENNNGYCFQTALKLNVKTGGRNQVLTRGQSKIDLDTTQIMGIEVTTQTKDGSGSVVLVVASIGTSLSQWLPGVRMLDNQPVNQVVSGLLTTQLNSWKRKHDGKAPSRIIIYHKGLMEQTRATDVARAIGQQAEKAKVTFIAVSKDHHTEMQSLRSIAKAVEDRTIPNDAIITRSSSNTTSWEFSIQGHMPQSTKKKPLPSDLPATKATLPVRYTVLYDDSSTTSDFKKGVEDLTHDMQYLSSCSTAATSRTLPIYYVGLLRGRIELFRRAGSRAQVVGKGDVEKKEAKRPGGPKMPNDMLVAHKDIRDQMFYI
ncbi:MAG: hypothetical protein LQ346_005808 [Caloplaca aetnensis]|nr:MAG: hypothetical protein LQ346_005808 [Caloplaca aetnensis]